MSSTVHYTLVYRSYKIRTHALRLCFCCFKNNSMDIKLAVFSLGRDVLPRIAQGIDLHTSAKFRVFNTNLNNVAPFSCPRSKILYLLGCLFFFFIFSPSRP